MTRQYSVNMENKILINKKVQPVFEVVQPEFGSSFSIKRFDAINPNQRPTWHYHPEIELVYVEKGSGKVHIGQHLSYFKNGALVLIGPNLPHLGFVQRMTTSDMEIVAQFKLDFLGPDFFNANEFQLIKQMLDRSASGIRFHKHVKEAIGLKLKELLEMNPFNRLVYFIKTLQQLAETKDFDVLNVSGHALVTNLQDNDRLDIIFKFVRNNFTSEIKLEEVAKMVSMTVPAFCRYFKKSTNKTFTSYVNEFKIVHATKLMSEGQLSLTDICFESGFNNQSHFIRQFKKVTSQTPSEYRQGLTKTLSM